MPHACNSRKGPEDGGYISLLTAICGGINQIAFFANRACTKQ